MSEPKAPHHNSKPITKKTYLHPLQRKILLFLASHEPKDKNETSEAIKGHYRSTWGAIKKLEGKKLIQIVSSKKYQGKEYPRYWLSPDGAFIAICEGAKPDKVIKKVLDIYPERKEIHYFLESISILGTEAFDYGYYAIINKGKLDESDIARMLSIQSALSPEVLAQYSKLLLKYPEQKQKFDDLLTKMIGQLQDLGKNLRKTELE